jgi:2-dehydropantoate 2-reductase
VPQQARDHRQPDPGRPSGPLPSVVVVGPGAVGSFLGGTLAAAGHTVTLLGRRTREGDLPDRLVLVESDGPREVPIHRASNAGDVGGTPGLVIVAVKAFHLEDALATAASWPGAPLMTVQNGAGAEDLARAARTSPLLAGSLTTAVEPVPGGVRRLRTGGMGVAAWPGDGAARAAVLAGLLAASWTAGGLPARVYADAAAMKWSKVLANLVGNATSAILDMDPGAIYADRLGYQVERRQLHEAVAVMRAMHLAPVSLPGAKTGLLLKGLALPEWLGRPIVARAIAGARGGKSPSLRLHVQGGGGLPTEALWLNGAVAEAGGRSGVAAPVNRALATLVDEVAADPLRAAWFAGRPDRLATAVGIA